MTHQFVFTRDEWEKVITMKVVIPMALLGDFSRSSEFAKLTCKHHGHGSATDSELLFLASEIVKFSEEIEIKKKGGAG